MVTVMGTSVGDTASYTCNDDGIELIGSMSVTCTSDGTWSDEPPMCRRKQFTLSYLVIQYDVYVVSVHSLQLYVLI